MKEVLWVGFGGFLGSVARWALVGFSQRWASASFPWGTFAVNLIGCCAVGVAAGLSESRGGWVEPLRWFVIVGFLGGFTTFSAFGHDTFQLLRSGAVASAIANVALQMILGVGGVAAGYLLSRTW